MPSRRNVGLTSPEEFKLRSVVSDYGGSFSYEPSTPYVSDILNGLASGVVMGIIPIPFPTGFSSLNSLISTFATIIGIKQFVVTISFTGGAIIALKFLREARLSINSYLEAKSKRKIIIKTKDFTLEVHGQASVDAAILKLSHLIERQQNLSNTSVTRSRAPVSQNGMEKEIESASMMKDRKS